MKRKMVAKILAMTLAAVTFVTSVPTNMLTVNAQEAGDTEVSVEEIETDEETGSEVETDEETGSEENQNEEVTVSDNTSGGEDVLPGEEVVETVDVKFYSLEELINMDLLAIEDDNELSEVMMHAESSEALWLYLQTLSEEDLAKLLERDTCLTRDVYAYQFDAVEGSEDADGNVGYDLVSEECVGTYYEDMKAEYGSGTHKAAKWNTSGSMSFTFNKDGTTATTKLDLGVTSAHDNSADYAASVYIKTANKSYGFSIVGHSNNTDNETYKSYPYRVVTNQGTDGSGNYNQLWIPFTYNKPAGYTATYTKNSGLNDTVAYLNWYVSNITEDKIVNYSNSNTSASTDKITTAISMLNCVGSTGTPRNTEPVYTIFLTPISYNVNYIGNGATSGSVASQNCTYGKTYTYQQNGYAREYTVTFDAKGGTPGVASQKATYSFAGWTVGSSVVNAGSNFNNLTTTANGTINATAKWNTASVKLPTATRSYTVTFNGNGGTAAQNQATAVSTFKNWAKSNGTSVGAANANYTPTASETLYANYTDGSVTLPSATRTGYKFVSWAEGNTKRGGAGASYTPGGNTTLTAQWEANKYTIKLDPNTGSLGEGVSNEVQAKYDAEAVLPIPTKTGYVFKGWKSDSATYAVADGKVAVTNLTDVDGDTVNLSAEWEAGEVKYTVNVYELNRDTNKYDFKESYTGTAAADSQITVPAKDRKGFITPASQLVTVKADGSTVVEFKYEPEKEIVIPKPEVDTTDIIKKLDSIQSIVSLSKSEWDSIKTSISAMTTLSKDMTDKLIDVIKNSSSLTEKDKLDILKAFAEGQISEELKNKLIKAIENSSLSQIDKENLISAIKSLSNLSLVEQVKIRELLEKGSSVSYTINGITYEIYKNQDGTLSILLKGLNGEKNVVIPDAVTVAGKTYAVTEISKEAFKNNTVIETVKMGNNITKIGDSAFEGCKNLKSVTIGPNVKEIGNKAFKNCTGLTKISIPSSVVTIGTSAFEGCTKLKTVYLHDGLLQIGAKAFYNCKALTKIKIPKTVLKIKSYAFGKCAKMKTLTFASGSNLTTLGAGVFSNCKVLTKVVLPGKLTSIPNKTFANDRKLRSCTGGAKVTRIGSNAFQNCVSLKKFTVTSKVQTIGVKTFYGCKNLKLITIKSNALTSVGSQAAKKCHKSLKIKCPTNKKSTYAKLFKGKY